MIKRTTQLFYGFFRSEQAGGILLIICVAISLMIANSTLGEGFEQLLGTELGFNTPTVQLKFSVMNWINDGLMAVFFFFIGLEIKQEILTGHLASFKKASVPVFAAIGGAILPALIFAMLNKGKATSAGWGIPMATDIAFALGALSILGKIVPSALKAFLSTLAVVDDLLAILVIAIFYGTELHLIYLFAGLGIFALLLVLNKLGVQNLAFYILPGMVMWYCIHHSGIHATIAGVLTAICIPTSSRKSSPLKNLAHTLATPVNFMIMPLFAIANTNIRFEDGMLQHVTSPLGLGIIIGLVSGKPAGVMLFSWLSVKLNIGKLPDRVSWKHLTGIGLLAGIGFTMSIFVTFLSFGSSAYTAGAKFAVLLASATAGIAGYFYLRYVLRPAIGK